MDLDRFSAYNRDRCESGVGFHHALNSWSLSDWMTATMGELGEAANIAKKLNRVRDGIPGNAETEAQLRAAFRKELADTFIYLDLMAQSQGIVLSEAVVDKFNETSRKIGYPVQIESGLVDMRKEYVSASIYDEAANPMDTSRQFQIQINRTYYAVSPQQMTGLQLRNLPPTPIGPELDLFQVVPGSDDKKVKDNDQVTIRGGCRFFTAPAQINAG